MKFSTVNDDMRCATSHWLYMTCRRLGRAEEASRALEPIHADMKILENVAYHHLLLMYKGQKTPESLFDPNSQDALNLATVGYGVGNWYLYNGQVDRAKQIFHKILEGTYWPAFGYIAAEADLKRFQ